MMVPGLKSFNGVVIRRIIIAIRFIANQQLLQSFMPYHLNQTDFGILCLDQQQNKLGIWKSDFYFYIFFTIFLPLVLLLKILHNIVKTFDNFV